MTNLIRKLLNKRFIFRSESTHYERGVAFAKAELAKGKSPAYLRRLVNGSIDCEQYDAFDRGIQDVLGDLRNNV